MGALGKPRTPGSGRKKGTPNKALSPIKSKAFELGIDPFEVLLLFAKGDWEALGYDKPTQTKVTKDGLVYEEPVITPQMRLDAAIDATPYMYAKKRPVDPGNTLTQEEKTLIMIYREKRLAQEMQNESDGVGATGSGVGSETLPSPVSEVLGPELSGSE